jgi:hypothetical protein
VDGSGAGIWSDNLDGLLAGFVSAWGSGASMTRSVVDGEPAIRIERPRQIAAAVLAVHEGRAYIITTQDDSADGPAPEFEEFLRQFRFLPETDGGVRTDP